jgi:hypothetical protein
MTLLPMIYGGCGGGGDSTTGSTLFFASKPFIWEIPAGSKSELTVIGVNGIIEVNGSAAAATVTISGEMRVGSSTTQDAQAHLGDLNVVITDGITEVKAETTQPSIAAGRNYIVDYFIVVPETFLVDVRQVNGEIVLSDLSGDIMARLANGSMDVAARVTHNGSIDLSGANMNATLTVPTITSAALSLSTANGSLATSNLDILDLDFTDNTLTGTLGTGNGQINISNANGSIRVIGAP